MGTFHDNLGELHGITVIVDTKGPRIFIGRCEIYLEGKHIVLNESDEHEEVEGGKTKEEYLKQASQVGFWRKHDRIMIKADEIKSVMPLNSYSN